jgi:hypothetical protein
MIWLANQYQKLPTVSLKCVGILTGGGGLLLPQRSQLISDPHPWCRRKIWHNGGFKISKYYFDPNETSGRSRPPST